MIGLAYFSKE